MQQLAEYNRNNVIDLRSTGINGNASTDHQILWRLADGCGNPLARFDGPLWHIKHR
jgi:hypothetical protein